jgi:hypothetical protein
MTKLATRRFMGYFGWGFFFSTGLISHEHLSLPDTVKL